MRAAGRHTVRDSFSPCCLFGVGQVRAVTPGEEDDQEGQGTDGVRDEQAQEG